MISYSVIVPVFNGSKSITELVDRLEKVFQTNRLSYEIILVNDGSQDNSWSLLKLLSSQKSHILAIDLLKNYGQHPANLCGFKHAQGEFLITIDDDLQNPPEAIPKLIEKANEGHDLVLAKWKIKKHSTFRKWGSRIVDYLNCKIFLKPKDLVMTNFRLIHKSIIERVLNFKGSDPYIPGLVIAYARNPANVTIEHAPRKNGESNYNMKKIFRLISLLLFGYSSYPLRLCAFLGAIVAAGSFLLTGGFIILGMLGRTRVSGWASLATMISFFSGVIIFLLGLLGEYIVQIIKNFHPSFNCYIREISKRGT